MQDLGEEVRRQRQCAKVLEHRGMRNAWCVDVIKAVKSQLIPPPLVGQLVPESDNEQWLTKLFRVGVDLEPEVTGQLPKILSFWGLTNFLLCTSAEPPQLSISGSYC